MAEKAMADYLSAVTADYTAVELELDPDEVLDESGDKEQSMHVFSDGQRGVVTLSDASHFIVVLQWVNLTFADAGTIMDFWHDVNKANARARSFYWHHPADGYIYTVRFLEPLSRSHKAAVPFHMDVRQIRLEVLGVKPS